MLRVDFLHPKKGDLHRKSPALAFGSAFGGMGGSFTPTFTGRGGRSQKPVEESAGAMITWSWRKNAVRNCATNQQLPVAFQNGVPFQQQWYFHSNGRRRTWTSCWISCGNLVTLLDTGLFIRFPVAVRASYNPFYAHRKTAHGKCSTRALAQIDIKTLNWVIRI